MFKLFLVFLLVQSFGLSHQHSVELKKRNIIIITASDFGFDDVSFHGSNEIPTPNIDALAYNSVILNRFYTPGISAPSRSSMLTGKYPYKMGVQNVLTGQQEPWGLPLSEKILPEYLRDIGYDTALVGKWHLGFYKEAFAPTNRGFDSFFGFLGSHIDYFNYTINFGASSKGYDLRRNLDLVDPVPNGTYATELFTDEAIKVIKNYSESSKKPLFLMLNHLAPRAAYEDILQAPESEIQRFSYIPNEKRQVLAAQVSMLDRSIGRIVDTLVRQRILKNTVILFCSDNGGPTVGYNWVSHASNFPLRGQKMGPLEGGIRANAFIFSPDLQPLVNNDYFHVSDVFPTLLNIAGHHKVHGIDGKDHWKSLTSVSTEKPRETLINFDNYNGYGYLIKNNLKFVNGTLSGGIYDAVLSTRNRKPKLDDLNYSLRVLRSRAHYALLASSRDRNLFYNYGRMLSMRNDAKVVCHRNPAAVPCNLNIAPCLFDIIKDPCEQNNLAESLEEEFEEMMEDFNEEVRSAVATVRRSADLQSDPINWNNAWTYWQEEIRQT